MSLLKLTQNLLIIGKQGNSIRMFPWQTRNQICNGKTNEESTALEKSELLLKLMRANNILALDRSQHPIV